MRVEFEVDGPLLLKVAITALLGTALAYWFLPWWAEKKKKKKNKKNKKNKKTTEGAFGRDRSSLLQFITGGCDRTCSRREKSSLPRRPPTGNSRGGGGMSAEDAAALPVLVEQLAQHALTLDAAEYEKMLRETAAAALAGGVRDIAGVRDKITSRVAELRANSGVRVRDPFARSTADVERAIGIVPGELMRMRAAAGFTADECDELAMQGMNPWDPDARAAISVLQGADY